MMITKWGTNLFLELPDLIAARNRCAIDANASLSATFLLINITNMTTGIKRRAKSVHSIPFPMKADEMYGSQVFWNAKLEILFILNLNFNLYCNANILVSTIVSPSIHLKYSYVVNFRLGYFIWIIIFGYCRL